MTLEELLKLIDDEHKESVKTFFTAQATKITTLSSEIADLEKKANDPEMQGKLDDAIAKRDQAKAQLTVVRETLGLPNDKEITKDLVTEHMEDASKGDAEKDRVISTQKADIEGLETLVESLKSEKTAAEKDLEKTREESKFIKVFSENMPSFDPASPVARTQIEGLLRVDAVLEGGDILYKGKDDSYIRVEGEKMTMKTRLGQIQDDPDYSFLFKTKASGGSGSGNGGTGGSGSRFEQRKRAANIS